jgi:hypothetical protein
MTEPRLLLRTAAVLVPALLVNAWFLLPDLVYQSHTVMALRIDDWRGWLQQNAFLVEGRRLFALDRDTSDPSLSGYGAFALPVLAMAWAAAGSRAGRGGGSPGPGCSS